MSKTIAPLSKAIPSSIAHKQELKAYRKLSKKFELGCKIY